MKQMSLAITGFVLSTKRTRKRVFLDEMNLVTPWSELLALIAPHAPEGKTGRPPFPVEVMLRVHLLQQFFGHSDPAMEEALHDTPLYREFAHLDAGISRLPNESTILRFRHLLEEHGSDAANLNSAISGNSGRQAGPRKAWREGVFDGQEVNAAHPQSGVLGTGCPGRLA